MACGGSVAAEPSEQGTGHDSSSSAVADTGGPYNTLSSSFKSLPHSGNGLAVGILAVHEHSSSPTSLRQNCICSFPLMEGVAS